MPSTKVAGAIDATLALAGLLLALVDIEGQPAPVALSDGAALIAAFAS